MDRVTAGKCFRQVETQAMCSCPLTLQQYLYPTAGTSSCGSFFAFRARLRDRDSTHLDASERSGILDAPVACVLGMGKNRREAAIGTTDPQVVDIDPVGAGLASAEDQRVLGQRSGREAAQADRAMLPHTRTVLGPGA